MKRSFEALHVAEGHIARVTISDGAVVVVVVDWREKEIVVEFLDVIGIRAIYLGAQLLSHTKLVFDDDFKMSCCIPGEEDTGRFSSFQFIEENSDLKILEVVAHDFSVVDGR